MGQEILNTVKFIQSEVIEARDAFQPNCPIQIGYFWRYAELHVLQFFTDVMDNFVDLSDFQYCRMDTDCSHVTFVKP